MVDVTTLPRQAASPTPVAPERAWPPLATLREEMDRVFNGFFRGFGGLEPQRLFPAGTPFGAGLAAFDVVEGPKAYRITAELPGLSEKDVEIDASGDLLTVKGEKREQRDEKSENYTLSERRYGSFRRSFQIPAGVDRTGIAASFDKGVLTVTLPKTAEALEQSRKIEVKPAG